MNGRADMEGYLRRLEAFRNNDIERETMVVELVKRLNDLQIQFDQKCIDYEDAVESRRTWQAKAMQSNRDLGEIQRATVSFFSFLAFFHPFVPIPCPLHLLFIYLFFGCPTPLPEPDSLASRNLTSSFLPLSTAIMRTSAMT
jgi:hypothetical protein